MGCIAKMLHVLHTAYDPIIYTVMPIPDKVLKPEFKDDDIPTRRLVFLDRVEPCVECESTRRITYLIIIHALALYGLYSLIF